MGSSADYDTGPPGIGKKTQCDLLCEKFGFQHISLEDVLRESSDDRTYPHAEFLKDCLREKVDVPKELTISLLERKINAGIEQGKKWSLIHGFPERIEELLEFEEKVGIILVNEFLLTFGRCRKQTTLCFSTAQLRGCSSVLEVREVKLVKSKILQREFKTFRLETRMWRIT